jgi:hypothetical protein
MKIIILSITFIVLLFAVAFYASEHSIVAKKFSGVYAANNDIIIIQMSDGPKILIPSNGIGIGLKDGAKRLFIDTGSWCGIVQIGQVYAGYNSSLFAQGSACNLNIFDGVSNETFEDILSHKVTK